MKTTVFDRLFTLARSPADAAGGGAPAAAPAAAAAAPAPAASPPIAPAADAAAAPPAAPQHPVASAPPAAAADYWPDGLDQRFRGGDMKATLDNLAGVVKGYRDRDAARDVPDKPDGFFDFETIKDFKPDDTVKAHFSVLKEDPAFKAMANVLHRDGVSRRTAAEALNVGFMAMSEAGLLEPMLDPKAEMAALVPEEARTLPADQQGQAVERRMQANFDFLKLAQANMKLDPQAAQYAEMMLGDAANGHKFLEWMRGLVQGGAGTGQPASLGGGGSGNSREALRAELAALNTGDPDYKAKHKALQDRYAQLRGD